MNKEIAMGIRSRINGFFNKDLVADDEESKRLAVLDDINDAFEQGDISRAEILMGQYPLYVGKAEHSRLARLKAESV